LDKRVDGGERGSLPKGNAEIIKISFQITLSDMQTEHRTRKLNQRC